MQDFSENPKLKYLLIANFMVLTCCIFDQNEEQKPRSIMSILITLCLNSSLG